MKIIFFFIASVHILFLNTDCRSQTQVKQMDDYKFLVGTYSGNGSEAIYYYKINPQTLEHTLISQSPKINNSSFLTFNKNQTLVYAVSENSDGKVMSFGFDKQSGVFKSLNTVSSKGAHPCHIGIDKTEKWIFVGNYSSGNLAVFPITANGFLGEASQIIEHTGSGPNKERQEKPHVHSVNISPDNKLLVVADLGTDQLKSYSFDDKTGKLTLKQTISISAGSGPRHFEFHPTLPIAYLIQEITGKVTVLDYRKSTFTNIEEVSTLPDGFKGNNACADIHVSPDGKYLYGSNRFYDTIVTYAVNQQNGKLTLVSQTVLSGKTPRNFAITPDGKYILVGNQQSESISMYERNMETGLLKNIQKEIKISMPVCIKFL